MNCVKEAKTRNFNKIYPQKTANDKWKMREGKTCGISKLDIFHVNKQTYNIEIAEKKKNDEKIGREVLNNTHTKKIKKKPKKTCPQQINEMLKKNDAKTKLKRIKGKN